MRVLIADDSALLRKNISKLITSSFPDSLIIEAEDVSTALDAVATGEIDAVVLDLQMPGGGGFEVLESIRGRGENYPVIVLTNHATEHFRQRSYELGADYFLDKSNEYEKILDLFKSIAASSGENNSIME